MCLILLAWRAHPEYSLIFAGNRDEAYERPSAPADFWIDDARIFGGRDLEKGGTWLGLTRSGRIAAVTNYRERPAVRNRPRSRGELASRYLQGDENPQQYLEAVSRAGAEYGPYSAIVGDGERLCYQSNRGEGVRELPHGVHGLSNHLINTPWPKIAGGKARLAKLLGAGETELTAGLFEILLDRTPAPEAELPDTGVGLRRERELSASFVAGDHYGTRASTVILIDRSKSVLFIERAFGPRGKPGGTVRREFRVAAEAYSKSA